MPNGVIIINNSKKLRWKKRDNNITDNNIIDNKEVGQKPSAEMQDNKEEKRREVC